jgi:uncharacterized OB-fold protein
MALIKCSGCGREISDKAVACPQCGCPVRSQTGEGVASRAPRPASPTGESRRKRTWIAWVGIIGFVLLVVTCSLRNGGNSNSGSPEQGSPAQQQAMTREQVVGQKTFVYWSAIASAIASVGQAENGTAQPGTVSLRRVVAQIRGLSTVSVDPDAVQCGNDVATALDALAEYGRDDADALISAALRGMNVGFFGALQEASEQQSAMQQQFRQVQTELDNARAILSSRYGVEFPRL